MPTGVLYGNFDIGNPFVDAMLVGARWDNAQPVTYYLQQSDWNQNGLNDWDEAGASTLVRDVFAMISTYADIQFVEVFNEADANMTERIVPQGSFYNVAQHTYPGIGAWGEYDILVRNFAENNQLGGSNARTFIHEIGHGLGLVHPHEFPGEWPGVYSAQDTGAFGLNSGAYSEMSYVPAYDVLGGSPSVAYGHTMSMQPFDVAALQALYGANMSHAVGNTTYDLFTVNQAGTGYHTIWDAGGSDTIRNDSALASTIDLRPASLEIAPGGGGWLSRAEGIHGGFLIANGAIIENAVGGSGEDLLIGNDAANSLRGREGDDTLTGFAGADRLSGGAGADVFVFAGTSDSTVANPDLITDFTPGQDRLDLDGVGVQSASVSTSGGETLLSLQTVFGAMAISFTGSFSVSDLLGNFVPAVGGTNSANSLSGSGGIDNLYGLGGADTIAGLAGDDLIVGGRGADNIHGGNGNDRIYGGENDGVAVIAGDNDVIDGGHGNDWISGEFGNDLLVGGLGDDTILGGAGDDRIIFEAGLDYVEGGLGIDTLVFDAAPDQRVYLWNAGRPTQTVTLSLDDQTAVTYTGIERLEIGGSNLDDTINTVFSAYGSTVYGRGGDDLISSSAYGHEIQDRLYGGSGNDTIYGDGGDTLDGGDGNDWIQAGHAWNGVAAAQIFGGRGDDHFLVYESFHVITEYAGEGNDTVEAYVDFVLPDHVENLIIGASAGAIDGMGNARANVLEGNADANVLDGGGGSDTASYAGSAGGVVVSLARSGSAQDTGSSGFDTLVSIENLTGSDFADRLTGDGQGNVLSGGGGRDVLRGEGGEDRIFGGADTDFIYGGAGADSLSGGDGDDRIDGSWGSDTIYGGNGNDTISGSSHNDFIGGNGGNDTLNGDRGADNIRGGDGGDLIDGGDGDDRMYGEDGADTISGGTGEDYILSGTGNDLVNGGWGNDFIRGQDGDDNLAGSLGDDSIGGGAGNDRIRGGLGNDVLAGNSGFDTFVFDEAIGSDNVDVITDFVVGEDTIELDLGIFTAITGGGTLSAEQFRAGTSATTADQRIIFTRSTGELFYDADGSGAGEQVLIARLDPNLAIFAEDFTLASAHEPVSLGEKLSEMLGADPMMM